MTTITPISLCMTVENVPRANLPTIMNIEDAKNDLESKRGAYVDYFVKKKRQPIQRVQNRINQYISRWKVSNYLETVEDYYILISEIEDMRKGQAKKRRGRPRRPQSSPKRRISQRLANKRQEPDTDKLNEDIFDFSSGCDQLDNILPSRDKCSFDFDRNLHSSPSNLFDYCDAQTPSLYSEQPLSNEAWCHSNDINSSGMLSCEPNDAGSIRVESLQQDVYDRTSLDLGLQGAANYDGAHDMSGVGQNWVGLDAIMLGSRELLEQLLTKATVKSRRDGIDGGAEMQSSSVVTHSLERAGNEIRYSNQLHKPQLYMLMTELKSQLYRRRRGGIQQNSVPSRRPLGEQVDLFPLMEQCLSTLRASTLFRHRARKDESKPEEAECLGNA